MKNLSFMRILSIMQYMRYNEADALRSYALCVMWPIICKYSLIMAAWTNIISFETDASFNFYDFVIMSSYDCLNLIAIITFAHSFITLRRKSERIAFLYLPANKSEKFIGCLLFYLLVLLTIAIIISLIGVIICCSYAIKNGEMIKFSRSMFFSLDPSFFDLFSIPPQHVATKVVALALCVQMNIVSVSILFSLILKNHAIWATFLLYSVVCSVMGYCIYEDLNSIKYKYLLWFLSAIFITLSILNMGIAWWRFRRMECVQGRFFNI